MINIIVWLVLLVVGIIFTILAVRNSHLNDFFADDLFFIGGAWVLSLAAATVIGFLNFTFNSGHGWYWFSAVLFIAPVCSVIYSIGRGIVEGWGYSEAVVWGGVTGLLFRVVVFMLGKFFYNGIELVVIGVSGKLGFMFGNAFLGQATVFLSFPVISIIIGLSVAKYIKDKKKREVANQAELQRLAEQQREAERNRAEQERLREQEKRVYDQWEKNEESEINNLLK